MTPKQNFNRIVRKTHTVNRHLKALRKECEDLVEEIEIHADEYDYSDYEYELRQTKLVLLKISSINLEESIPEKHTIEY